MLRLHIWVDKHLATWRHCHLLLILHLLGLLHLLRVLLHHLSVGRVVVHDLLLRRLHRHAFEWVDVLRVHEVVLDDVFIDRGQALLLQEVLHAKQIETLLLQILKELLFFLGPEVIFVHGLVSSHASCL